MKREKKTKVKTTFYFQHLFEKYSYSRWLTFFFIFAKPTNGNPAVCVVFVNRSGGTQEGKLVYSTETGIKNDFYANVIKEGKL